MSPPPPGPAPHLCTNIRHMTQLPCRAPAERGPLAGTEVKGWECAQSFHPYPGSFTHQSPKYLGCASEPCKEEPLWECRQGQPRTRRKGIPLCLRSWHMSLEGIREDKWLQNPRNESSEQPRPAFLTVIWLAHGIPIIPSHLKQSQAKMDSNILAIFITSPLETSCFHYQRNTRAMEYAN